MRTNRLEFFSGSYTSDEMTSSIAIEKKLIGKWEVDPDDGRSVQFRIPSQSFDGNNDRIGFYVSASGQIGIGTKDPETAFDVRDNTEDVDAKDRSAKTKIFKVTKKAQQFDVPVTGSVISASSGFIGNLTGNAATATSASYASTGSVLSTARTIGGVSFDGSANINLPGVNTTGNQNTSGTSEFTNLVNSSTAAAKSGLQFTFDAAAGTLTITDKATRTTFTLRKD